jgi:acetyl esterase/lipase
MARRFVPDMAGTLERRALLSANGVVPADHRALTVQAQAADDNEIAQSRAASFTTDRTGDFDSNSATARSLSYIKVSNIPFPTVDGQAPVLDVYLPTAPAPAGGWPVLVAIHGGGWRRFGKDEYGPRIASAFVPRGYVVVAPNYVLSAPGDPTWPLNFEDVEAAVRWVREQAKAFNIDPDRVAAIGESAGANLAALLGTPEASGQSGEVSSEVNAVIAFSTPTGLTALYAQSHLGGLAAAQFLGGTPAQVPANYVGASPIDHVSPADAPMLLVHGLQDPLIPVSQSREMAAALAAAGVRHQLILVNGGHNLDFPAHYANLIPQILAFLNATWKD